MPGLRGSVRRFGALFATSAVIGAAVVAGASPAAALAFTVTPTTALLSPATAGATYTQTFGSTNGTGSVTFAKITGAFPAGLTLNSTTGVLSGTPTDVGAAPFDFAIQATDSATPTANTAVQSYNLTVNPPILSISPTTLPPATANTPYTGLITGQGGTGPYTFTPTTTLPAGITLSSGGTLGGMSATPGTYNFSVKVQDSTTGTGAPFSVVQGLTLVVAGVPAAPTGVTATAGNASASVTLTPPAGLVDHYTVTPSPATVPATVTCLTLPCNVGPLVNGTPYTFTVTATNSAGTGPASAPSNVVRPGTPAQTITFNPPATVSIGSAPTLTATSAPAALPVTFTSSTASTCTVTSAGVLTPVAVGTCTISADQAGDATHATAVTNTKSITITVATPTVTVTSSTNPAVSGQPLVFTATLTAPVTTTGTVTWTVTPSAAVTPVAGVGTASAISAAGTATFTPVPALAVGSYSVKATYVPAVGDTGHLTNTSTALTQVINKASTTTAVAVSGNTITATVAPVAPGTGVPTGTVAFTVGSVPAGTGTVGATGIATITGTNVGTQSVVATYSGDASFTTSTGNRATVVNPTITASVISGHAKTSFGWYRSTVKVIFTCTQGSAPLTAACPSTVKLSAETAGRTVTRTVTATDGGTKTVTTSKIKIDGTAPKLTVKQTGHTLKCKGSDSLSGLASCKITKHSKTKNGVKTVTWSATATDKAGNKTKKHGHFSYSV